jgi:hypothetical protein
MLGHRQGLQSSRWGHYPVAWGAFLAGPVAWCVNLECSYALAPHACAVRDHLLLHLSTLACLGAAAAGGGLAWLIWGWHGRETPTEAEAGPGSGAHFLSVLGLVFDPFFALLIVSQWLAIAMLDPCPP